MNPPTPTSRQRLLVRGTILVLLGLAAVAGVYLVAVYPPTDASFYPKCQFHSFTGLHCPGCGVTRAVHSALNGRFEQAFAYNALAILVVPYLAVSIVRSLWAWMWGTPRQPSKAPLWVRTRLPIILGGLLFAFWIVRNIPVHPFTLLAPHELTP